MPHVAVADLRDLLSFIYTGEVKVGHLCTSKQKKSSTVLEIELIRKAFVKGNKGLS
jgi:hypothetical protein